ncbi:MAG: nodulation factor ABC transporter ATP-binding protein NodI, partial [Thiomonas sp. 14-64-326]
MSPMPESTARLPETPAPSVLLELDQVYKSYGRLRVVDGLSLRLSRGECYGIIGPNGAGKTTTIQLCLGLA